MGEKIVEIRVFVYVNPALACCNGNCPIDVGQMA